MKFLATEFRDDGEYGVEFEAEGWDAARARCDQEGWRLNGECSGTIPAGPDFGIEEANALIDQLNRGGIN